MKKIMTNTAAIAAFSIAAILNPAATAHAFDGAKVCEKVKTCVLESMEGQEVPENVKEMLMTQLDTQCIESYKDEEEKVKEAGLNDEAQACANDMLNLSCSELMNPEQANQIESCKDFEEKRIEAGLDHPKQ